MTEFREDLPFKSSECDIIEELQDRGSLGLGLLSEFQHVRDQEEVDIVGDFDGWSRFFDLVP
jgi:hypothetical protein